MGEESEKLRDAIELQPKYEDIVKAEQVIKASMIQAIRLICKRESAIL